MLRATPASSLLLCTRMAQLYSNHHVVTAVTARSGPYGPGQTDDKPFLHARLGVYYLSWGCYYATSASVFGPYLYAGMLLQEASIDPEFQHSEWMMDRSVGAQGRSFSVDNHRHRNRVNYPDRNRNRAFCCYRQARQRV
jgi:hypothetical protein